MGLAEEYRFSDFTRDNYRKLIQLASEYYHFSSYPECKSHSQFILWRHDVDFSVHSGVKLAEIEAEVGVASTFFLYLHSPFYNLFELEIVEKIRRIISLGHRIGLHFDPAFYEIRSEVELEIPLAEERDLLQNLLKCNIDVFSMHNPVAATLSWQRWEYAGMINTYASYFQNEVGYCSDSNGYWRHDRLEDVLRKKEHSRLQVLTHPCWWQEEPMSPRHRVHRCIDLRAERVKSWYDRILTRFQRLNVDEETL